MAAALDQGVADEYVRSGIAGRWFCRGRRRCSGAGTLQLATGGQRFVVAGFCGVFQGSDIILDAPHDGAAGIFLTFRLVNLLHVVGVAFERDARLFGVKVDNYFGAAIAGVVETSPGTHHVRRWRSA